MEFPVQGVTLELWWVTPVLSTAQPSMQTTVSWPPARKTARVSQHCPLYLFITHEGFCFAEEGGECMCLGKYTGGGGGVAQVNPCSRFRWPYSQDLSFSSF